VRQQLRRPVVQALCELVRLRNSHPAFDGEFNLGDSDPGRLVLCWQAGSERAELEADLASGGWALRATQPGNAGHAYVCVALDTLRHPLP
jgi:sucrose phosphorylase